MMAGKTLLKLAQSIGVLWERLVRPYHLYTLSLASVYYDEKKCHDVAVFRVENLNSELKLPLQRIARKARLLENLDALDLMMIEVLLFEEIQHANNDDARAQDNLLEPFLEFPAVASYFYSETQQRNMLVLNLEDQAHEACLSIREIANMPDCLAYIRHSETQAAYASSSTLEINGALGNNNASA